MWGRMASMVTKEFGQLLRDWPILGILLWTFTGQVIVAGNAVQIEVKDFPFVVVDHCRCALSRELIERVRPPEFKFVGYLANESELESALNDGDATLGVIIPPEFARQAEIGQGRFQIILDGTQSQSATLTAAYLSAITRDFSIELLQRQQAPDPRLMEAIPSVEPRIRVAFNPTIDGSWFASLLELFEVTTMVAMLLTAAALVREKSQGTLEQILVTPLRPAELFAAKILPTIAVVLFLMPVSLFAIVVGIFHTPLRGSLLLFFSVTAVYVFSVASLGILIAVFARNIAQAMLLLLLILWPMVFLSGAFTPPESMSPWMKYLSTISPLRYYMDFGYQVLFKGNGIRYVWQDILGIVILGTLIFSAAVWRFRTLVR